MSLNQKKNAIIPRRNTEGDLENNLPYTAIHRMNFDTTIFIYNNTNTLENGAINDKEIKSNKSIIDLSKVCHVCFCYSTDIITLKNDDHSLADMYAYITSLEILSSETINFQVCDTCRNDIIYCYQFKLKCEKSYHSLLDSFEWAKNELDHSNKNFRFIQKIDIETQTESIQEDIHDTVAQEYENIPNTTLDYKEEHDIPEENVEYLESEYFEGTCFDTDNLDINNRLTENSVEDKGQLTVVEDKPIKTNFYCGICQKKFLTEKSLKAHFKCHKTENDNLYNCTKCKETFGSEHDLNIHSALHSKGNKWTCNKCLKEFNERARLRRHIRRHFERKRYSCEWCGKQFAELCALRRHARVHTGQRAPKTHLCPLCDKRYTHASQLRAHVAAHAGARPCACDTCGKRFPSRRLLASHRLVHSDLKPHACAYCDKRFRHESTRNTHHRTHTGEKPYICSICGKTFIQNSNLTLHMRTHTGEKPYSCETCGRTFKSGSSLNNHMRTHTGEKPYECTVCGKKFARASMAGHMRRHTGERSHACCACRKTFATPSRLRDHARVHTGEKPYKCSLCPAQYTKDSCLAKHLKKHETDSKSGNVVYVHKVPVIVTDKLVVTKENGPEDGPTEVSEELILQDDNSLKTGLLVINDGQNITYQSKVIANNYAHSGDISNINLVSVNEGLASSELLQGTTVKLYSLNQNLVQIHTSTDQVTVGKIASKITTDF